VTAGKINGGWTMTLQIIVVDMAGKKFRMGLPEDIAVGRILPQIVTRAVYKRKELW
jgi:hypothetical protein